MLYIVMRIALPIDSLVTRPMWAAEDDYLAGSEKNHILSISFVKVFTLEIILPQECNE